MSTLQAINLKHPSSGSNNVVLDSSGNATVAGNLSFNSGYGSSAIGYGCRAWVNFNGTGTVAIRGSGNVSSITDNGVGDYTVNFTTAMPDANYSVSGLGKYDSTNVNVGVPVVGIRRITGNPASGSVRVCSTETNAAAFDAEVVSVAIFR